MFQIRFLTIASLREHEAHPVSVHVYKVSAVGKDTETFLNEVLSINGINVDYKTAIENFYVAVIAQEKTGVYGFYGDPIVWNKIREYPIYSGQSGKSVELTGTSAIVLKTQNGKFTVPSNGGSDIRYIAVSKGNSPLKPNEGEGTEAKPYVISEAKELNELGFLPSDLTKLVHEKNILERTRKGHYKVNLDELYKYAIKKQEENDLESAFNILYRCHLENKNNIYYIYNLFMLSVLTEKYDIAIECIRKLVNDTSKTFNDSDINYYFYLLNLATKLPEDLQETNIIIFIF